MCHGDVHAIMSCLRVLFRAKNRQPPTVLQHVCFGGASKLGPLYKGWACDQWQVCGSVITRQVRARIDDAVLSISHGSLKKTDKITKSGTWTSSEPRSSPQLRKSSTRSASDRRQVYKEMLPRSTKDRRRTRPTWTSHGSFYRIWHQNLPATSFSGQ